MILHLNSRKKSYIVYCLPICSYLSPWHVVAVQLELFPCPLCSEAWPRLLSHQCHVERVIWGATYLPKRVLLPCIPAPPYLPPVCSHADKDDDLHAGAETGKIPVPAQLWRAEPPTPDLSRYSCYAPQKQTGSPHNNAPWGGEHMKQQLRLSAKNYTPKGTTALLHKWHSTPTNGSKQQCSRKLGKK